MKECVARFGRGGILAGVVTEPDDPTPRGAYPTVLFLNAGLLRHVGPHRLHVRLARRLSRLGITSLRFDRSGLGDSGPRPDRLPSRQSKISETQEAMDHLARHHQARSFVLFGLCAGADQAFRVAREDHRVVGLVLVDGYMYSTRKYYVRRLGRSLLSARSWRNVVTGRQAAVAWLLAKASRRRVTTALFSRPPREEAETQLRAFIDRAVNLCLIFTEGGRYNYPQQFWDVFPSIRPGPRVHLTYFEHVNHTFVPLATQQRLLDCVESWIRDSAWEQHAGHSCAAAR